MNDYYKLSIFLNSSLSYTELVPTHPCHDFAILIPWQNFTNSATFIKDRDLHFLHWAYTWHMVQLYFVKNKNLILPWIWVFYYYIFSSNKTDNPSRFMDKVHWTMEATFTIKWCLWNWAEAKSNLTLLTERRILHYYNHCPCFKYHHNFFHRNMSFYLALSVQTVLKQPAHLSTLSNINLGGILNFSLVWSLYQYWKG